MMSKQTPFVSLIVVNYNGKKILGPCLNSLQKIFYPKDRYEILVVDNNSTDGSQALIKKYKSVKLIQNKKNLGYVGINSALSKIKGKYFYILNNDIELDKHCVRHLVDVLEDDTKAAMCVPRLVNHFNRKLKSSGTWVSRAFYTGHYISKEKLSVKEIPYLGVGLVRTSIAKKFGYIYDPDYFIYAEDLDFSLRCKLLGLKTMMHANAIMIHRHAVTTMNAPGAKMTFYLERNLLLTWFKVFKLPRLLLYMPYILGFRLVALAKDLVTLDFGRFWSRLKALLWIPLHFSTACKKRHKIQSMRRVSDAEVAKLFSEKYLYKKKVLL